MCMSSIKQLQIKFFNGSLSPNVLWKFDSFFFFHFRYNFVRAGITLNSVRADICALASADTKSCMHATFLKD